MANVLIINERLKCKARYALYLKVFLFFFIPSCYYIYSIIDNQYNDTQSKSYLQDDYTSTPLRHLLAVREESNCTPASILEFPPDGFTRVQRQHGYIVIHCVLAIYCFLILGAVCEHYFVPAIGKICERLNMAEDIAGATFMAAASSSPELFINCVGTFVTKGDLGVGAIVGSAVFNVLAVPACCGILAGKVIELDWWSVSRDCLMYAVAVLALILTLLDNRIYWHEALVLVVMYTIYILAMVFNGRLSSLARTSCCYQSKKNELYTEITPLLTKGVALNGPQHVGRTQDLERGIEMAKRYDDTGADNGASMNALRQVGSTQDLEEGNKVAKRHDSTGAELSVTSVWSWPSKATGFTKFFWILTWPICFVLWATIPDCRRHQNMYPVTFIMCIIWIGGVSYQVAWIITIFGDTLGVPDSITGLTFLAAGTSLPEAVSSVLVTKQGHGSMGISNSIGSNTFDILLCLGLPWFVKALLCPTMPGNHWVTINSAGLSYNAISLLTTLFALYASLALNKFRLDLTIGITCSIVYVGFLVVASLIELNVFSVVNLPICPH